MKPLSTRSALGEPCSRLVTQERFAARPFVYVATAPDPGGLRPSARRIHARAPAWRPWPLPKRLRIRASTCTTKYNHHSCAEPAV